jgi:predicted NBD/HSP70 family sugar kinase
MGDRLAIKTLRKAGEYLGVAVANLINILNPSTIVIGGRLAGAGKPLIDPMKESIRRYAIRPSADAAEILQSGLGDDAGALGGVTLVLNEIFE